MSRLGDALRTFWCDEDGVTQAETAILIAVVALATIGALQHLGDTAAKPVDFVSGVFR
jgi:Flp pilus assembly pilin Flp